MVNEIRNEISSMITIMLETHILPFYIIQTTEVVVDRSLSPKL